VVSDDVAKRYDLDLQRGIAEIAAALERHDHERMTAEAQVFIAALQHDIIDAGDFAARTPWPPLGAARRPSSDGRDHPNWTMP
jgi:hypothetical protein